MARLRQMLQRVSVGVLCGEAGVGKSALAYAMAREWGDDVVHRSVRAGEALADVVDDVRRALGPVVEALDDEERMLRLGDALERGAGLLVLDDLHHVRVEAQRALLRTLGGRFVRARLLVTTRQRPPWTGGEPDCFIMRLGPLAHDDAEMLWSALDELHAVSPGFEQAWRRCRGNPFLLRQAHAGAAAEEDPLAAAVQHLDVPERRIASVLAVSGLALPRAMLCRDEAARDALARLVRRLVVDVDGSGACTLHDAFRDAIVARLPAAERREALDRLSALVLQMDVDPVRRIREACRCLVDLERWDEAGELLVAHAQELVRHGAAGELLRGCDAIPPAKRSLRLRVTRARTLSRLLKLADAFDELRDLVQSARDFHSDLSLSLAQIAMLTGHLDAADDAVRPVVERSEGARLLRARMTRALVLTHRGEGDRARGELQALEHASRDAAERAALSFYRAFTLWLEERDEEAVPPADLARERLVGAPLDSYQATFVVPTALAAIYARAGRLEEADDLLRAAEQSSAESEDLLLRVEVQYIRACHLLECGARAAAERELRRLRDVYRRAGYTLGGLWVAALLGRVLLWNGRLAEGWEILEQAGAAAQGLGLPTARRLLERSRDADVRIQLATDWGPSSSKPGERHRARALSALRAAAVGEAARVDSLRDEDAPPDEDGYGIEMAVRPLCRAVLACLGDRGDDAHRAYEEAVRVARERGVDPGLMRELANALGTVRVIGPDSRCVQSDAPETGPGSVVVDERRHTVTFGSSCVSLTRKPVVRKLLYALAAHPNEAVDRDVLARALWSRPYSPRVHEAALKMNVLNLRKLLSRSGLTLEADDSGYRLLVPSGFLFISALERW